MLEVTDGETLTHEQVIGLAELVHTRGSPARPEAAELTASLVALGLAVVDSGTVSATPAGRERLRRAVIVPAQIAVCGHCGTHFKVADLPGDMDAIVRTMMAAARSDCPDPECRSPGPSKLFATQAAEAVAWWVTTYASDQLRNDHGTETN